MTIYTPPGPAREARQDVREDDSRKEIQSQEQSSMEDEIAPGIFLDCGSDI
jgi:hypothetical protein